MNSYAFEELLLTCCQEQGWEIERNFRYSGDGDLDGRVTITGKLYLIQAKRYSITVVDLGLRAFAVVMISSNGLMHSAPVRPVQDEFK